MYNRVFPLTFVLFITASCWLFDLYLVVNHHSCFVLVLTAIVSTWELTLNWLIYILLCNSDILLLYIITCCIAVMFFHLCCILLHHSTAININSYTVVPHPTLCRSRIIFFQWCILHHITIMYSWSSLPSLPSLTSILSPRFRGEIFRRRGECNNADQRYDYRWDAMQ